jgi:hypothetical protein
MARRGPFLGGSAVGLNLIIKIKIHHFAHRLTFPPSLSSITLLQASRQKFKMETFNQVPRKKNITIPPCDGGFSRCALLSLAMLWNQLNYITTVQVHVLINLFRNALGFLRVLGTLYFYG